MRNAVFTLESRVLKL